jgi:uncharacterized protein involved in exopolysaccharide biosynthesis
MTQKAINNISFNILDLLYMFKKRILFFLIYMTIAIAASIVVLMLLPKSYRATTVLFPPKQNDALSLASQLSFAKLSGSLLSPKDDFENYLTGIFQSRSLKEDVIKQFDLIKVYKFDKEKIYYFEDVIKEYDKHFGFSVTDEGMMVIDAVDGSPVRAAEMANYISKKIDEIYRKLMSESAKNQRQFIESRLNIIKKDLDSCEKTFNLFQKEYSLVNMEEQTKATIEANAAIEAQIFAAQQKLDIAKKIYNYNSPEIRQLELEIKTVQKQKNNLYKNKTSDILIPLSSAPDLGLKYVRLKRDLLIQENLFEFAMTQYETAKYEEAKQTPNLLVLDPAKVPDKRFKPKRTYLLIISFILNSIVCLLIIFSLEYWLDLKKNRPELYCRITNLFKLK